MNPNGFEAVLRRTAPESTRENYAVPAYVFVRGKHWVAGHWISTPKGHKFDPNSGQPIGYAGQPWVVADELSWVFSPPPKDLYLASVAIRIRYTYSSLITVGSLDEGSFFEWHSPSTKIENSSLVWSKFPQVA